MTMADTLFVGGRIWTGDPARSQTDAMLVRDGRVAAFDDEALAQRGRVREYDLGGGMLMPGFNDGHCHPQMAGEELAGIPLDGVTSVDDVLARVRDYAAAHRDRAWLLGGSYLPTISPGGEFRREWLDNVVRDRPVVLNSADRHSLWLNTRALEIAGIDASTPDPSGGVIVRDADGTPTGLVQELAQELVTDRIPKKSDHDLIDELAIAVSAMADAGITWAQCAGAYLDDLRVYEQAWAARSMPLGMGIALWTDPERWREQLDPFAAAARAFRGGDGLTLNSVKFWGDGAIASADHPTAAMIEPYETDPHWHGVSMWTTEEMQEAAAAFDRAGFQLHIHGIGDAAVP
jgi:predicted amidohydrolase YtcJ